MKKIVRFLPLALVLILLSGCYKSDTTIKVNVDGSAKLESTVLGTADMYKEAGGAGANDIVQSVDYYKTMDSAAKNVEVYAVDADGNRIEDAATAPADGSMTGAKMTAEFSSVSAMTSSTLAQWYLRTTPFTTAMDEETLAQMGQDGNYGIVLEENAGLFATVYTASGNFSLYGGAEIKGAYDQAEQSVKDAINNAEIKLTYKFPLSFNKSNADSKNLLGTSMTWIANAAEPEQDVYFKVTVINPVALVGGIIILLLAITVIILAMKLKKQNAPIEPSGYFTDEDGNEIPIYDVEEDGIAAEDGEEVAEEETDTFAEATEELSDEAEAPQEATEESNNTNNNNQ